MADSKLTKMLGDQFLRAIKLLKPLDLNGHRIADVLETSDRVYFNPVGKIKQLKNLYDHYICEPGGVFCMQHELSYRIKVS